MKIQKVVITGVTGFFGSALAKELLIRKVVVYGIGRNRKKLNDLCKYGNFIPVESELSDYNKLPDLIKDPEIDVFYHMAWAGGFTTAIRDYSLQLRNAAWAGDALVAAKEIGAKKFVYSNTYNQYEIENFLSSEISDPRWTNIYSTGKTAGSLICRTLAYNYGIEYTAGLIPMPYGKNNYSKQLVNVVLDALNKGISPKLVEGNNLYDLVYIGDISEAFIALGEKGRNMREYYVGHRELKTFKEWMIMIRDAVAPDVELKFGDYKDNQQIDYAKVDLDALYRDTGFECKADFNRTIREAAEWVKDIAF